MDSVIVLAVICGIVGTAVWYIRREKKRGARCIGCPDGASCSGNCAKCSGCCSGK